MINSHAEKAVKEATFSKRFGKPLYNSYCFSNIPGTLQKLLGVQSNLPALPADVVGGKYDTYDLIFLLFVDGFGWKFFEKYVDNYPFLKRFVQEGVASKITTQFPSTTANHVTCMNTGLNVGQSGVYEWFYYEPKLDRVIAPLLFSYAGDGQSETLRTVRVDPYQIYPNKTIYEEMHRQGITSHIVQHLSITHSTYSQMMFRGAQLLPYASPRQAMRTMVEFGQTNAKKPDYVYFYFGDIDGAGHRQGIGSPGFEKAVDQFFTEIEEHFWQPLNKTKRKTACVLIADHGMVPVDPETTFYINKKFPVLQKHLKRNAQDKLIAPAGSCRDFFLHIKEEHLEETHLMLKRELKGKAEIYKTEELIQEGLFGNAPPSAAFKSRVGNLVILPYINEAIWWYEKGHFEQRFLGAHGGLTRDEMETIFLFLEC
ncbi:MAG: alkaline phosphatase family protein [Chlamydiales bacterium]